MVEITDEKSLEAWLETQPQEVHVTIAARAALRALPGLGFEKAETLRRIALPVFRTTLTSAVAAKMPTAEVKEASASAARSAFSAASAASARSAASAAFSADSAASAAFSADSAASAAFSADSAAFSARSAARSAFSAAFSAVSSDAEIGTEGEQGIDSLWTRKLWLRVDEPPGLQDGRRRLMGFLQTPWRHPGSSILTRVLNRGRPDVWMFWRRWYTEMFEGRMTDWELCRRIVLIPDDIWYAGPVSVARAIQVIEAELDEEKEEEELPETSDDVAPDQILAEEAPMAETIVYDAEAVEFDLVAEPLNAEALVETHLVAVSDALEDATGGNLLQPGCWEHKVLLRALERYRTNAMQLEMTFTNVHQKLAPKIGTEYPDVEEVSTLSEALNRASLDIRNYHPDVRAVYIKRIEMKLLEGSREDIQKLKVAMPLLVEIASKNLGEEFQFDMDELVAASESLEGSGAARDSAYRLASRIAQMYPEIVRNAGQIAKKTAKVGFTAATILVTFDDLIALFLRLFGLAP